jgi:hypothetical protein
LTNPRLSAIAAAAALVLGAQPALAQFKPEFKFSGYGTLGAVYSSERDADYVSSLFQPNGAGHTRSWSLTPDTRLGAQLDARFTDKLSAVVQVLSQHQYDNSFTPQIEWANVKYQLTPEVALRAGRFALPIYMISESRFVGYGNPWVHAPVEVYNVMPVSANDGIDVTWRARFGSVNSSLSAYIGSKETNVPSDVKVDSRRQMGISETVEVGSWTLRASVHKIDADLDIPAFGPLLAGLGQFAAGAAAVPLPGFQAAAAQANALREKYRLSDLTFKVGTLGLTYDPGDWFVMAEAVVFKGDSFLSDSRSGYVTAGYRFGTVTPYATIARTVAERPPREPIDTSRAPPLAPGAAALDAGVNMMLDSTHFVQTSVGAGVRWDFRRNMALKAQVDRINTGTGSSGRFGEVQPGFKPGSSSTLISVALDFVF